MGDILQTMGCGSSITSGSSNCNPCYGDTLCTAYSMITVPAGQHTQHCLWVVALKHDKYFPKAWYLEKGSQTDNQIPASLPAQFNVVTPCTGGCLYPPYGVGTAFGMGLLEGFDTLTITEAIYPTKIVMRSRLQASLVITYTIGETHWKITKECSPHDRNGGGLPKDDTGAPRLGNFAAFQMTETSIVAETEAMNRLVVAQAQAILAESPLPEVAVRPAPMQQQQPAPVQQQPVPAQTLTKFCSSCGAFLDASTQFCGGCGTPTV